jgi:hypothetical protein
MTREQLLDTNNFVSIVGYDIHITEGCEQNGAFDSDSF